MTRQKKLAAAAAKPRSSAAEHQAAAEHAGVPARAAGTVAELPADLTALPRLDLPPSPGEPVVADLPGERPPAPPADVASAELVTDDALGALVAEAVSAFVGAHLHGMLTLRNLAIMQAMAARILVQLLDARDRAKLVPTDLPHLRQLLLRGGAKSPDLTAPAVELAVMSAVQLRALVAGLQAPAPA